MTVRVPTRRIQAITLRLGTTSHQVTQRQTHSSGPYRKRDSHSGLQPARPAPARRRLRARRVRAGLAARRARVPSTAGAAAN